MRMHGRSNLGRFGNSDVKSKSTSGLGGRFQITTAPPHSEHQITGTTVGLLSFVVVIHVLDEMSLDVISSVETSVGTVVMVEVITGVPDTVFEDVDVIDSAVAETGKVVVLPSTFRTPEDPKDTDKVPLINAEPPGVRVIDPMTTVEPPPNATMLGARVIAVLENISADVEVVDASVTALGVESVEIDEPPFETRVGCARGELKVDVPF